MSSKDISQRIRMSLPPGTKLTGERGTYIVKNFICMSSRSTTVSCEVSNGTTYRLKLYNGQYSTSKDLLRKAALVMKKGVIAPFDIGEYGGCPFVVSLNVNATDTSKYPISQNVLIHRIIPQMAYVIQRYHQSRILLRDICPEHILYRISEQQIAYCGFNNLAVLPERATITKEQGYGEHPAFIAPEVPQYGYSTRSDYYSLGLTLLCMMLGRNPMENMSWNEIQTHLRSGIVPGINMDHLRNTAYDVYSAEDKVLYLILGLMLPNPKDRWGYGEIRCWCNNQHIPLVRKEGRIFYQYNEPFIVNRYRCWNYQQLTKRLAMEKEAWTDDVFQRLNGFAQRQNINIWNQILKECQGQRMTTGSKIFKAIYGINPALDGFWWKGKKYLTTEELIREAASQKSIHDILAEILRTQSLSYFLKMRKRVSYISEEDIADMMKIEQWEISEPGKGVNRCLMRFARSVQARTFKVKNKEFQDMDQLLKEYSMYGTRLKKESTEILKNKTVQAWLWANGMEEAGVAAQRIGEAEPEQSYYLLLKIMEDAAKTEAAKQLARKMYLVYGEYAPVYWLSNHIDEYKMISIGDQILYDTFKNANIYLEEPLEKLSTKISRMVPDYQHFVSRTAKRSADIKEVDLEFCDFSFYPLKKDGFFDFTWDNDIEVTQDFFNEIDK